MKSLLQADFRRVLKDKLLMVMGILAVAFATLTPLLYSFMFSGIGGDDEMLAAMTASYTSGKALFFNAFSLGNNLGLITPVLLAIVLCKDFSFGTVRNKIIAGKSRSAIFISLFITCATVFLAVMLLHALVTLGVSLLFFDYQQAPFTMADFWYFLESLVFSLLMLLCMSAMLSWLCANAKNVGLAIVLYIAFAFGLALVGSILQIVLGVMEAMGGNENTISVLRFIDRINIVNAVMYIGKGSSYSLKDVLYLTIPAITGTVGFLGLGLWKFNKKDLK